MATQFKREPLTDFEVNKLIKACESTEEKLTVFTLLDTGLRVKEYVSISKDNLDWQRHELVVHGKGGPFGKMTKRRVIPLSSRLQGLLEPYIAANEKIGFTTRTAENYVTRVAN